MWIEAIYKNIIFGHDLGDLVLTYTECEGYNLSEGLTQCIQNLKILVILHPTYHKTVHFDPVIAFLPIYYKFKNTKN